LPSAFQFFPALVFFLDAVHGGKDQETEYSAADELGTHLIGLFTPANMTGFFVVPPLRTSRELNIVLDRKRYHRLPEFAVVAAEKLEVNHVAAAIASITPVAALRIEVERGGAILMVRQRTATGEPGCASKRLEVCVASGDHLDGHGIANGLAALTKSIRSV